MRLPPGFSHRVLRRRRGRTCSWRHSRRGPVQCPTRPVHRHPCQLVPLVRDQDQRHTRLLGPDKQIAGLAQQEVYEHRELQLPVLRLAEAMLKVVALTAVCELAKEAPAHGGGTTLHFDFTEYALLDNRSRILLRGDRGLSCGPLTVANMLTGTYTRPDIDPWLHQTAESLERSVLAALEYDTPEEHEREVASRLLAQGITVNPETARTAVWRVEFGKSVLGKLA